MARYTGPKNRLARAQGKDLGLKTNVTKLERRLQVPPGQHGPRGRRGKVSDYGTQLKEKQRVRWTYGVLERQFRRYFAKAANDPHATGLRLLQLLEMRLDNIIYRLQFAPTRTAARQFVNHGHILVNAKKVSIPSYQVRVGDVISLRSKITQNPVVKELLALKKPEIVKWLKRQAAAGKVVSEPKRDDIDADISEQLIVEYYSR